MTHKQNLTIVALMALALGTVADAELGAQQFDLSWHTIDGGGGYSVGGTFELGGTIGQPDAGPVMTGGGFELAGGFWAAVSQETILVGDVNLDGVVNLLDVAPFVELLVSGDFQAEADINQDGVVDLLDVQPFVQLLTG